MSGNVRRVGVAFAILCTGCASSPVRYYSLLPSADDRRPLSGASCCNVSIARLTIPPEVDRPEIVVRQSNEELMVMANDVWAAPLRDEMQLALLREIRRQLHGTEPSGGTASPMSLRIDVQRFEAEFGQYALIEVAWRAQAGTHPQDAAIDCSTTAKAPVKGALSSLVQGYQRALTQLSAQVATALIDIQRTGHARCPNE